MQLSRIKNLKLWQIKIQLQPSGTKNKPPSIYVVQLKQLRDLLPMGKLRLLKWGAKFLFMLKLLLKKTFVQSDPISTFNPQRHDRPFVYREPLQEVYFHNRN